MQYFTYISVTYTCKNQLYKDILAFLYTNDRKIIEAKDLEAFKKSIVDGVNEINTKNPRCKPIKASWNGWHAQTEMDSRLSLGYGSICTFNIYQSK